mgnify:CR=1 FL=1
MATSTAIVRILLATCLVSVAALGVGLYGLLRAPVPARASAPDELAAIRSDLAELRHSLDLTRSQQTSAGARAAAIPVSSTPKDCSHCATMVRYSSCVNG